MKRDSVWVGEITVLWSRGQENEGSCLERGDLCPFNGPVAPSCSSYSFNTDIVKIKFGGVYQKKKKPTQIHRIVSFEARKNLCVTHPESSSPVPESQQSCMWWTYMHAGKTFIYIE